MYVWHVSVGKYISEALLRAAMPPPGLLWPRRCRGSRPAARGRTSALHLAARWRTVALCWGAAMMKPGGPTKLTIKPLKSKPKVRRLHLSTACAVALRLPHFVLSRSHKHASILNLLSCSRRATSRRTRGVSFGPLSARCTRSEPSATASRTSIVLSRTCVCKILGQQCMTVCARSVRNT